MRGRSHGAEEMTEDREAFFIKEQETDKLLGFVMINTYVQRWETGHSIAEFMVLPKFRRTGIGKRVARACFDRYPGNWEVSPSYGSGQAYEFWKRLIRKSANHWEEGSLAVSPQTDGRIPEISPGCWSGDWKYRQIQWFVWGSTLPGLPAPDARYPDRPAQIL